MATAIDTRETLRQRAECSAASVQVIEAIMKIFAAVGTTTGALALVLAGCSSTSSDPSASETSSSEATENAAGIAYKIVKQCTDVKLS